MARDPASLENLQDIVVPEAVAWWPVAPGWYGIAFSVLAFSGWYAYRRLRRWHRDAYRREALQALAQLKARARPGAGSAVLAEAATLLRRVALSAYPRSRVAALGGERWLSFLDETGGGGAFADGAGRVLLAAAYRPAEAPAADDVHAALLLCERWIRAHQAGRG
jgi:hypothetical protein